MRLGLDIGGTKTSAVVLNDDGSLAVQRTVPSGYGSTDVLRVATSLAQTAAIEAGQGLDFIGACMPGLVDPGTGVVRHAVNLGVTFLDLAGELESVFGQPVIVENDVKAAAIGAHRMVSARAGQTTLTTSAMTSHETFAYLNLGTGLAAAIVLDGRILRGPEGMLGEIGHLPVGGTSTCPCGQTGCLETIASGSALARMWAHGANIGRDPFSAAMNGDAVAGMAAAELCRGASLAVQILALAAGAAHIVIGGGLASLGRPLESGIRAELGRQALASDFVASLGLTDRFELLPSHIPIAALGAAALPQSPDAQISSLANQQ